MSWTTGIPTEVLFNQFVAGSALTNTTTSTLISPRGNTTPLPFLAAGFFHPTYGTNKGIRIVARGVVSTATATPGTLTITVYFATSDTATLGTSTGAASGAFTPAVSLSNAIWELEVDITCTAPGSTPNFVSMGQLSINPTTAAGAQYGVGGTSTTSAAGLSTEQNNWIQVGAAWGSASASNSITMYQTVVYGLN